METLKTMVESFDQKKNAIKTILGLGNELTQEKLTEAQALKADCDGLQTKITALGAASAMKADVDGYESFLKDPVRNVPFGGAPAGAAHVGTVAGGHSVVEYRGGAGAEVVYEDGGGVFGERAWKAIQSPEYKTAFRDYLRLPKHKISAGAMKTLEDGLDDQGGYTVPVDMIARVIQRKPTPTRVAGMVNNINTSREFLEMIKVNYATDNIYTTGFRVTKTGENPASATAARVVDSNLFGTVKIPVHTFMISAPLTLNMVEDSALNIQQWVEDKFGETIDILKDDKVINGSGKMEPRGMLNTLAGTAAGQGTDDPLISTVKSGSASALTGDGLINISEDVPEQYDENCRWLFNKTNTHKAIRTLKDSNGRYLFGYGYQDSGLRSAGRPTDVNGYPYSWSGLMPNVGAGAFPILFGDFMGYQLVNRVGFSVQVLRELYAELGQIVLLGRIRFGGQVVEPWRLRGQLVSA